MMVNSYDQRHEVYERDAGVCQHCSISLERDEGHIDHVLPRSRGGDDFIDNLQLLCKPCNMKKGGSIPEQDIGRIPARLARQPEAGMAFIQRSLRIVEQYAASIQPLVAALIEFAEEYREMCSRAAHHEGIEARLRYEIKELKKGE